MAQYHNLKASDLMDYTASQVASLADVDPWSVKAEGFRRQTAAEKKIIRLRKQLAQAEQDLRESGPIIQAAFAELDRANQSEQGA